ncbi:hypothetical protein Tco_1354399 [Tanacetum coccineum]
MLDHPLSYALTATADVPVVYLQQFWKTVSKVPDTKDTIKFKLDRHEIAYTVDMFCSTLQLLVETPANSFIAPATMKDFPAEQRCYSVPRFTKLIISDLMKKYPFIPQILKEDYHFIKCDILLMSVYSTGNVTVQWMLIPDAFFLDEIRATGDYREYETVFVRVVVLKIQPQLVVSTQETHCTTPRTHRSPTLTVDIAPKKKIKQKPSTTSIPPPSDDQERDDIAEATLLSLALHKTALAAEAQENVAKVQEKLVEEDIENMVEGKEDEESYASEFADSVFNDDEDDFRGERNIEKEKKDGKKDDYKDKDNDDHTDHTLVRTQATGSMEIRKEKLHTLIPSPSRSPRKNLSSDKNLSQELTESVSPSTATTSKDQSKKIRISKKYSHIPGVIHRMCRRQGYMIQRMEWKYVIDSEFWKNNVKRAVADTIIQERNAFQAEVPAIVTNEFVDQAPRIIKELFKSYVSNNVIHVHPTTSTSTTTTSSTVLQQQLYLKMKSNLKDQATDPELDDVFRPQYHDDHQEDDTPPEGEKRAKR